MLTQMMKTLGVAVLVSSLGVNCFAVTIGPPVSLDTLLGGGEVLSGDFVFNKFSYAATEDMPDADAVNVIPIMDEDGSYGLRFQGGFIDLPGGSPSDALITFSANVSSPEMEIIDVDLVANLNLNGPGFAEVTETFLPEIPMMTLNVFDSGTQKSLVDSANLAVLRTTPLKTLQVQKDISLRSAEGGIAATVSFVDQTFAMVPEPSSVCLIFVGVLALFAGRK